MRTETKKGLRVLHADEGNVLIRGGNDADTICERVYLGVSDSPGNWSEIPESEARMIADKAKANELLDADGYGA